jgi:hypothetical protein
MNIRRCIKSGIEETGTLSFGVCLKGRKHGDVVYSTVSVYNLAIKKSALQSHLLPAFAWK